MQIFHSSEFGDLDILIKDGQEFFPATACAKLLGYANPRDAILRHCKSDGVSFTTNQHGVRTPQPTQMNYITEGNLYRLIVNSKLPAAERFEKWVFEEVLISIRKNGAYVPDIQALVNEAVRAAVSAVLQELTPQAPLAAPEQEERKRERFCNHSIISHLDTGMRQEIKDLLLEGRYTYVQLSAYLYETYGLRISKSAIGRHAKRLYSLMQKGASL